MAKFVGISQRDGKRTTEYASPKNVIKFGMRKPDMSAGQFDVVEVHEDGTETKVLNAYKTVSLTK